MKERAILFCLMVLLLSACAPVGTLVQPTPTPTKTPRPIVTSAPGPTVRIEYLEHTKEAKTAVIELTLMDPTGYVLASRIAVIGRGQVGIAEVFYEDLGQTFYSKVYLWVDDQGRLHYREAEEGPEWRLAPDGPFQL